MTTSAAQRPINAAIIAATLLTVALAAFALGAWSSGQRCNYYRQDAGLWVQRHQLEPAVLKDGGLVAGANGDASPGHSGREASLRGSGSDGVANEASWDEIPEPTQFVQAFPENRAAGAGHRGQQLRDEVAFLRRKVLALRQAYGAAYCALRGIGPTGGFCVGKNMSGSTRSGTLLDTSLCAALGQLLAGQRVADLGAGRGHYGTCLKDAVRQYVPYDGGEGVEDATGGVVRFLDLSEPTWLGISFDWVMSLEVGEHIPVQHQDTFIGNVLRHAERGVVMSWAVPGQGGHHHVNEQPNSYVVGRVRDLGGDMFAFNETATTALRSAGTFRWFKNTVMVFDRVRRD